jgi:hypothetical protein
MDLDQMVAALDIHIVGMALGVAMLAASQIGRHMGRRVRGMDDLKPSKFDDASIGLLTLLLAFSFGTSIAKHDQRRRRRRRRQCNWRLLQLRQPGQGAQPNQVTGYNQAIRTTPAGPE